MNPTNEDREIYDLLVLLIEDDLKDVQRERLINWSKTDPDAAKKYADFVSYYSIICREFTSSFDTKISSFDSKFDQALSEAINIDCRMDSDSNVSLRGVDVKAALRDAANLKMSEDSELTDEMLELLEMERNSPAVVIEKTKPAKPKPEIRKVGENNFQWFPGEGNKPLLVAIFTMAACFIAFIGYIHFTQKPELSVVAELLDSIDSEWDNELMVPDEFGVMVQSIYRLDKGYASILFNGGAKVTVEAPAEFSLLSGGDMQLISGRIYAIVPGQAVGFTIMAGNNKIVDLGTEFGIEVDRGNNTQLHVTKGKTLLFSGLSTGSPSQVNVSESQAKKVYSDGFVKDIDIVAEKFVRQIDSKSGSIFRGHSNLVSPVPVVPGMVNFKSVVDTNSIPALDNSYGPLELAYNFGFAGPDIIQDGITFRSITHSMKKIDPDYGTTNGINVSATTTGAPLNGFNVVDNGDDLWQTISYTDKSDTLFLKITGLVDTEKYQVQILFGDTGDTFRGQTMTYDKGKIKVTGSNGQFVTAELKYGDGFGNYALAIMEVEGLTSLTFEMPKATLGPGISGVVIHKK